MAAPRTYDYKKFHDKDSGKITLSKFTFEKLRNPSKVFGEYWDEDPYQNDVAEELEKDLKKQLKIQSKSVFSFFICFRLTGRLKLEGGRGVVFFKDGTFAALAINPTNVLEEWVSNLENPDWVKDEKYIKLQISEPGDSIWQEAHREYKKDYDLFDKTPLKAVKKFAPKALLLKLDKEKKEQWFKKTQIKSIKKDSDRFEKIQEALENFIEARGISEKKINRNPRGVQSKLKKLESFLKTKIPNDLRALYEVTDGCEGLFFGNGLMPLDNVIFNSRHEMQRFKESTWTDLQNTKVIPKDKSQSIAHNPRLLRCIELLGQFRSGPQDGVFFDLTPGLKGQVGQLVTWGWSSGKHHVKFVSKDILKFLKDCIAYETTNRSNPLPGTFDREY